MYSFFQRDAGGKTHRRLILFCWVYLLSACQGVNPTLDTITTLLPGKHPALLVSRGFEYILLEIDGRKTAMALGSREQVLEDGRLRVHERWYSGHREMIHLVDGRIHTALGLTVEWRGQRSSPPVWQELARSHATVDWDRVLDIMPGYRYGHLEHIQTHQSSAPRGAPELPAGTLWFSDVVSSAQPVGEHWLFRQHFAWHLDKVIYSEQCLSPQVCFKFTHLGLVP